MKKLFSFTFIMSLVFSLCACSFSANQTENSNITKTADRTNDPTTPDKRMDMCFGKKTQLLAKLNEDLPEDQ